MVSFNSFLYIDIQNFWNINLNLFFFRLYFLEKLQ
jgi:hypothetical protein